MDGGRRHREPIRFPLPYNREVVPHLLRLTDENYDASGNQLQLFGFSVAAKRYALYPKAHGLIFFAPSEEGENKLPKWWWELWRFVLVIEFKQILQPDSTFMMIAGHAIGTKTATDVDGQPSWINLPR